MQSFDENYLALPAKVSQQVLKLLDKNWVSFFQANKAYYKSPSKFLGKPKLPNYKDKAKGRNIVVYDAQAVSIIKKGYAKLSKTSIEISTQKKNIKQIRIVPRNQQYVIEVVYAQRRKIAKVNKKNIAAIDLGLNNLCTITSNKINPQIIAGTPLKSINQYYNKQKAKLQSCLPKNTFNSNRIVSLTNKRNNKVDNYLHNASRTIINTCLTNDVGTLVIGYNSGWKDEINLGSKTNQGFVGIPHKRLIDQLTYKADLVGMKVVVQEESYTSKCSLLDNEPIRKHETYLGKRIKRGMFKASNGERINADVNGSGNILRKAFPRVKAEGIEGLSVNPVRVIPYKLANAL
jgi:putative transposase